MTPDAPSGAPPGDDQDRIDAYLSGDHQVFGEIDGWIRAEVLSRYRSLRDDHEDVCQVVHEKLLTNLRSERFAGRSSLRSYVSGIVHHTSIDRLRGRYRDRILVQGDEREAAGHQPDPYQTLETVEERSLLHRAIQLSPASCRRLWQLVFVDRLSYVEIGDRLGVPPGTVKSRSWHCRRKALTILQRLRLRAARVGRARRASPGAADEFSEPR